MCTPRSLENRVELLGKESNLHFGDISSLELQGVGGQGGVVSADLIAADAGGESESLFGPFLVVDLGELAKTNQDKDSITVKSTYLLVD